mmetsp:Transcript_17750/g.41311  ORF Transcript_17750/g.41311 Transcript_17750/m.41311 type:complete len:216 (+) Transcript_17750:85-732(+)
MAFSKPVSPMAGDATKPKKVMQKPPAPRGPIFLMFTDATEEVMQKLEAASNREEVRQILKECMKIDEEPGLRTETLADFHYHNYSFCVARNFSAEKTSTFLSIMRQVLDDAISLRLDIDATFDVARDWMLKHSVQRPPFSVGIFTYADVKAALEFAHNTFFRHFRLYMYTFRTLGNMEMTLNSSVGMPEPNLAPSALRAEDEADPGTLPKTSEPE